MLFAKAYSLISYKSSGIMNIILAGITMLSATSFTAVYAQTSDVDFTHNQSYRGCIQLAHSNAEEAFETSLSWEDQGGGLPARHCSAIALFNLEHYREAANRLQQLANEIPETVSEQKQQIQHIPAILLKNSNTTAKSYGPMGEASCYG